MQSFKIKDFYKIEDLCRLVSVLRDPDGGCPWDSVQTHVTLKTPMIEEAYEVVDAIDCAQPAMLREELGDVLLQVVFHAQLAEQEGNFDFDDVCDAICKKLIYRHPQIFSDKAISGETEEISRWDNLKEKEKNITTAAENLAAVPVALPALMRAQKVQKRAAGYGFSYCTEAEGLEDLRGELAELCSAMEIGGNVSEEIGDVLFSMANLARLLGVEAEQALGDTNAKFVRRVTAMEDLLLSQGKPMKKCTRPELLEAYNSIKEIEKR